jgi:antitoxin (DNA-binding transcriptional repressor) of toxin-antitoxin stability system
MELSFLLVGKNAHKAHERKMPHMNMTHTEIDNARLARLVKRAEKNVGTVLLRQGEPVVAILPYEVARCALAVSDRYRKRQKPFTQEALDAWIDKCLSGLDWAEFMQTQL